MIDHSLLSNIQGATNALERALAGEELSFQDGLQLIREENLFSLGAGADLVRNKTCGNTVTFTSSYYLNYTNVCLQAVHYVRSIEKATKMMLTL